LAAAGLAAALLVTAGTGSAAAVVRPQHSTPPPSAPVPHVQLVPGPVPLGPPTDFGVSSVNPEVLAAFGYRQQEFFISGLAQAYTFTSTPGADGRWSVAVAPASAATYTTRIVVYTPSDRRRFSGTVVVEWDNVTIGADLLPDLVYDHATPFRNGDAYVGVSAQFVGVDAAKLNDPARYGTLNHSGDSYSYDIFSQAGMAVWRDASQVLDGLRPSHVIADGESQSGARMVTYINAFAPLYNVYDGYLVHSRGLGGSALQQPPGLAGVLTSLTTGATSPEPDGNTGLVAVNVPPVVATRTGLATPVLTFETQTDVYAPPYGLLTYGPATQANSADFRLWEVAGTAHADDCLANRCATDTGNVASAIIRFDDMLNPPTAEATYPACSEPLNTGEEGYTLGAALQQLTRWVVTGGVPLGLPASSPPLFSGQSIGEGATTVPELDSFGNIIGGVRSPAVDVRVATITGMSTNSPLFCILSGTTTPLPTSTLTSLYPTHQMFVEQWAVDAFKLALQGYLTFPDALDLVAAAQAAPVP
jgi:hypothetical protein